MPSDRRRYENNLAFEGSLDGKTYTELFVVGKNVHEGWNYFSWDKGSYPGYRYYQFRGLGRSGQTGPCRVNEVVFAGNEVIENSEATYDCPAELIMKNEKTIELSKPKYVGASTPSLTKISPRFGSVKGGETVTFTGVNFSATKEDHEILIDGIRCVATAASTTSVSCTSGSRPGLPASTLSMTIKAKGHVATRGRLFYYVRKWSDPGTWGGEFAPMEGETVSIPEGMSLLVDVDSTPVLKAVINEGALLFMPNKDKAHVRTFDAQYIFVKGKNSYMEVGTEEDPYTSKITITMHSKISDPYIPIYGNKCIGLRYGTLDMHGVVRSHTWTVLEKTAEKGATEITLKEAVDWVAGETIGIAATGFDGREGEKRQITKVDATKKILTLDAALEFKHFAETYKVPTGTDPNDFIDMRAEVGLLSRNVRFRGNPADSTRDQYGAIMFMHSEGDDSLIARLEHVEFTDVGQAFKLGRYAIHFHMIGAVHKSYVKGVSVHQGFNRAFTIHGTHYLRLEKNVAYEVKGHTVFIEDAIETKNYIYKNLIMKTKRSWSLLNTDQTPACFWITHPYNNFVDNHAAGSDRYGYWYDLQIHSMGPSANTAVCPENAKVGQFSGNHAHSNGRYGLRIFHNMVPRKYPCRDIKYDWAVASANA